MHARVSVFQVTPDELDAFVEYGRGTIAGMMEMEGFRGNLALVDREAREDHLDHVVGVRGGDRGERRTRQRDAIQRRFGDLCGCRLGRSLRGRVFRPAVVVPAPTAPETPVTPLRMARVRFLVGAPMPDRTPQGRWPYPTVAPPAIVRATTAASSPTPRRSGDLRVRMNGTPTK